jgi:hypothetical protein
MERLETSVENRRAIGEVIHKGGCRALLRLALYLSKCVYAQRQADAVTMRALRLEGLSVAEGLALLGSSRLEGDDAAWTALVGRYAGNPPAYG